MADLELYFLRHGHADWASWDVLKDDERPLTDEGLRKIAALADSLLARGVVFDKIIASPLVRANQTASVIAQRYRQSATVNILLRPGFSVHRLANVLDENPQARSLLLVGHEPDFSTTIAALIGGGRVVMKKGGLARVIVSSVMPLRGELVWLLAPFIYSDND